jgi:phosphate transport system substrate-binding protein
LLVSLSFPIVAAGAAPARDIEIPKSAAFIAPDGDLLSIGFAAANRGSPSVRTLALAAGRNAQAVAPTVENILAGRYPLDRFLLIYARRPLMALAREFLRLVLSPEGQKAIAESPQGYLPLSATELSAERAKLE